MNVLKNMEKIIDGDKFGYGGYKYKKLCKLIEKLIKDYKLTNNSKIFDIDAEKVFYCRDKKF